MVNETKRNLILYCGKWNKKESKDENESFDIQSKGGLKNKMENGIWFCIMENGTQAWKMEQIRKKE